MLRRLLAEFRTPPSASPPASVVPSEAPTPSADAAAEHSWERSRYERSVSRPRKGSEDDKGQGLSSQSSSGRHTTTASVSSSASSPSSSSLPQQQFEHIFRLPKLVTELEHFLLCGVLSCLDTLLWYIVVLPFQLLCPWRATAKEWLSVLLIASGIVAVTLPHEVFDYGTLYHVVRASSTLKLYMIFNMLEIGEKVLGCFGSDVIEALYASAVARQRLRVAVLIPFACLYIGLHTVTLLLQIVSIDVALNSDSNTLFGLLVSNNFVEIKGHVFKRFSIEGLFQIACSDAIELFQYGIFTSVMLLQHARRGVIGSADLYEVTAVLLTETVVDLLKHAFIMKFNNITPTAYNSFYRVFTEDVLRYKLHFPAPPQMHFVPNPAQRFGFVPFPYAALLLWSTGQWLRDYSFRVIPFGILALAAIKCLTGVYLSGKAAKHRVQSYKIAAAQAQSKRNAATRAARSAAGATPIAGSGSAGQRLGRMRPSTAIGHEIIVPTSSTSSTLPSPTTNEPAINARQHEPAGLLSSRECDQTVAVVNVAVESEEVSTHRVVLSPGDGNILQRRLQRDSSTSRTAGIAAPVAAEAGKLRLAPSSQPPASTPPSTSGALIANRRLPTSHLALPRASSAPRDTSLSPQNPLQTSPEGAMGETQAVSSSFAAAGSFGPLGSGSSFYGSSFGASVSQTNYSAMAMNSPDPLLTTLRRVSRFTEVVAANGRAQQQTLQAGPRPSGAKNGTSGEGSQKVDDSGRKMHPADSNGHGARAAGKPNSSVLET